MRKEMFDKRHRALWCFAAFSLFILVFCASVRSQDGDAVETTKNIIASHDSISRQYNKNCMSCHSNILTEKSLDPSTPSAHMAMLPYVPGKDNTKCVWCHRAVDLVIGSSPAEKSTASLRKRVNTALCTLCHGPSGPGIQFYQSELSPTQPDGPALYELVCAACHRSLSDSQVKGKTTSEIGKAIAVNKGGMSPLGVLTTEEIQAMAGALAQ